MRVTERMKKWISMILCLCMLAQNAPMMVFAASTDNLCDHHPKHTEDCGYVEAVAGSACTHKHSEACYEIVDCKHTCSDECDDPCTTHTCTVDDGCITRSKDCHHVHGECGYAEAVEPQDCTTCQPVLVHAQNCGYVESAAEVTCACEPTVTHRGEGCTYVEGKDGSPCTHVCAVVVDSDDSCYKLLCSHKDGGHDDACGYAAAVEGHACHYECSVCEDNAEDDSPVPEGVCAHGNSEESCETCVAEIQTMVDALPDMEDITDENRADVISRMEAIDSRKWKLSDAARGKLDFDKYADAAFVLGTPPNFFGFAVGKRYEVGASEMPQASFAFLDASGMAATVITAEGMETTSVEPVSNGAAVRGYLPVGEYTLDETVVGDWNLTMTVNGQADGDHTFTGEGGRAYRIETINYAVCAIQLTQPKNGIVELSAEDVEEHGDYYYVSPGITVTLTVKPNPGYELDTLNVTLDGQKIELDDNGNIYTFEAHNGDVIITATFKPLCEHTTEKEENKATCSHGAICDNCSTVYTEPEPGNHDASVAFDNGFCPNGCYESAELVGDVYQISNAGQLYWFAEQVNSGNKKINGKLMADILVNENVLKADGTPNDGEFRDWTPMGKNGNLYGGTFDGNGKTISGLYFNDSTVTNVGLFGLINGRVENVGIVNSYFMGYDNVGGVIGTNYWGTVTKCYNTGTVNGSKRVGGVVGYTISETITNCYNTGTVNGSEYVGGVVGKTENGIITNCYYLTGTANGGINGADAAGEAEAKTTEQFASGEVAYLLGEPFGQNIDNGQDNQGIPCFSNAKVYAVKNCKEETVYSNTNKNIGHKWNNGVCSICGTPCPHNTFDSTTGECSDCKTDIAVASVKIGDTTTNFETLAGAVTEAKTGTAEAPATLTLLKNINLGTSYQNIESGVMTLNLNGCKLEGSGPCVLKISGTEARKPDVTITDGKGGGTITGAYCGVVAENSNVTVTGGTITSTSTTRTDYGVYASGGTVEISGGTISGDSYGVYADLNSTVTIGGGTISGYTGVYASGGTVTIKDGTITGSNYGVVAEDSSTVEISGGEVSGDFKGVWVTNSTMKITGGKITGQSETPVLADSSSTVKITGGTIDGVSFGVIAEDSSTVEISGGTITCGSRGLLVDNTGSIILGLGEDGTGATFPDGLNVSGATLDDILDEGAAYWKDGKMISLSDNQIAITGGIVTVKAVCEHTDATYPEADIEDTTHKKVCPCGYEATENHTVDSTTGECQYCKTKIAVAMVEIGDSTPTYFETLYEAVIKAGTGTAEAPATLTLLQDIDLGESYQEINSGVFTLDLNGCTLTGSHSSYGVLYLNGCNLTITDGSAKQDGTNTDGSAEQGGTISGGVCGVYATNKSTLIITGGTISGGYGVNAHDNSTVKISGGTITGTNFGVNANKSTVTISGGEVSSNGQYSYGVYANESAVTINGGKISATGKSSCGVYASSNSTVTISGGKITGNGESSVGVYASYNGKVEISGGTITGTNSGVYAYSNSNVTINGGTVSGDGYGVNAMECTVKISGGTITGSANSAIGVNIVNGTVEISSSTISGYCGVYASSNSTVRISGGSTITGTNCGVYAYSNSTVEISGGTITGEANDLRVLNGGSFILGLGEDDIGATFPDGLNVEGAKLKAILDEGAAYWQGTKMLTDIADYNISGTVTVKAVCEHKNATYPDNRITDEQHTLVCSKCGYEVTENHTLTYTASGNVITESCSECNETLGTATITANGKTYNGKPVTAAVQKTGVLIDSNIGITYSQNGEDLNESVINAGTYTASIKLGDAEATVEFTITPATLPDAVLSETGYTYNGQQQKPAVTVTGLTENTDYTVTYPQDVTNAGEKTVTITGKGNYAGTVTKTFSIAKANSTVTKNPQAVANLVYNGKNQNLVIAGETNGGTMQYSLDGKNWAAAIPVGKAAKTYNVSYKVAGDANHEDSAVQTLAVTIGKGAAPAVDTLIQTHFYAYATANTVDLTKYLPADRGTTAYTVVGVSADIFSSVPAVTNAGVLSYTTRKLTAAPASDTQIRIKAVMENYADAELTVTVKLLAVTAQTQQKIVKTELTEVPAGLAGTRFHSVNAIKTEQKRVLGLLLGYDPQGNILHYDVKLQFSPDGGKTWVDATEENFPANGLTITLPYPGGTGKDTHNFVVSHMFTTGAKAGTTETPTVTKTADGIQFTVTGLSPVSVAWSAIPFDVKVANVTNGTVYVSPAHTAAGTQVTITATPKSGYRLSSLAVKDAAGNSYTVSTDNNGKYYFIMPAADVTVTATFTAKSTAVADTTNPKTGDDFQILFWGGMMMTTLLGAAALMLNKQKYYER